MENLTFQAEGGWGRRDYPDFAGTPDRDEDIWRAGCRLTRKLSDRWSVSGVFNFDRFDSDNDLFAADRYLSGILAVYEF